MTKKRMIDADKLLEWVSDAENTTRYYGVDETLTFSTLRNRIFDIITSEATTEESLAVESDNDDLKIHDLKISQKYLGQILNHGKLCEVRKNDRNFQAGDILILKEWSKDGGFSGKSITRQVTHIETYEQKEGYVVLSISDFIDTNVVLQKEIERLQKETYKWQPIEKCKHKNNIIGCIIKNGVRGEAFECEYVNNQFQSASLTDLMPHKPTHYLDLLSE